MKYLKTYEDFDVDFNKELIPLIETWLQHNKLDYVRLNDIITSGSNGINIYNSISKDGNIYRLNYKFVYQIGYNQLVEDHSTPLSVWTGWGAKQIWNYLEGLTQEEIEEQRASNEAEKFNF